MEKANRSSALIIISGIVFVLLLVSNIFTVYLLIDTKDSLNNKSQTLVINKEKIGTLEKENSNLKGIKTKYDEVLKDNEILDGRVNDLTAELTKINGELKSSQSVSEQAQNNQSTLSNNPSGVITVGSSKDHVRQVMGNPDSIVLTSWWYGKQSWVSFDNNGLVDGWYNGGNNLKTK